MSNTLVMCSRCRERKNDSKIVKGAYGYKYLCKRCKVLIEPNTEHRGKL